MQFMASLKTMQKDAGIVMAVCFLLFLVVTFASLSLMVQHLKKDVDIMLRIGADRKYTTRYMLLCVLPVILLAAVSAYSNDKGKSQRTAVLIIEGRQRSRTGLCALAC